MSISRREMLKLSAATGASLLFGRLPTFAQRSSILRRTIPSSGVSIPAVGLGTARTFNVGTSEDERRPLREVLRLFVEMGGTLVDTAPVYGNAEPVLGDLARDLGARDQLFMATKVSTRGGREVGIQQMEGSIHDLRPGRIDLMQVHNLRDVQIHLATLSAWKEEGRIRYTGLTTSSLRQFDRMGDLMENETVDFVQLNYSIKTRRAERRLLPLAADRGIAVIINVPYERGRLFRAVEGASLPEWAAEFDCESWGQFFLKFILSHPAVTCVIPATSNPQHLVDNMGAGDGRLPDGSTRRRMAELFDAL